MSVVMIVLNFLPLLSIGAFHWIDRASTCLPLRGNNRKSHSIQTVLETVVQEIRKLLLLHPMLAIATKATLFGNRAMNESKWNLRKPDTSNSQSGGITALQLPYREYMPSVWQTFVTHRILLRPSDDHLAVSDDQNHSVYLSEWLLPSLSFLDKFIVKEVQILPRKNNYKISLALQLGIYCFYLFIYFIGKKNK
ncbi:dna repair protein xrcc2 like protein [Quercus suber]|uniref:Dna repair protein xrcc2 like protein n=1 Tax=Quercus suber TaxID=58331 RepID=A0AAW0LRW2_QUESU